MASARSPSVSLSASSASFFSLFVWSITIWMSSSVYFGMFSSMLRSVVSPDIWNEFWPIMLTFWMEGFVIIISLSAHLMMTSSASMFWLWIPICFIIFSICRGFIFGIIVFFASAENMYWEGKKIGKNYIRGPIQMLLKSI